jgi:hypothetical protein
VKFLLPYKYKAKSIGIYRATNEDVRAAPAEGGLVLVGHRGRLVTMDWQGNVNMQVEIGTAFWLFLVVVILALILWYSGYLSKVKDTIMNSF